MDVKEIVQRVVCSGCIGSAEGQMLEKQRIRAMVSSSEKGCYPFFSWKDKGHHYMRNMRTMQNVSLGCRYVDKSRRNHYPKRK